MTRIGEWILIKKTKNINTNSIHTWNEQSKANQRWKYWKEEKKSVFFLFNNFSWSCLSLCVCFLMKFFRFLFHLSIFSLIRFVLIASPECSLYVRLCKLSIYVFIKLKKKKSFHWLSSYVFADGFSCYRLYQLYNKYQLASILWTMTMNIPETN